jgi:hypothetical protein
VRIIVAADHGGFGLKNELKTVLERLGHTVTDLGTNGPESTDYPDYAHQVAKALQQGSHDRGLLVCGTGVGMAIAANRHAGVRAVNCTDTYTAGDAPGRQRATPPTGPKDRAFGVARGSSPTNQWHSPPPALPLGLPGGHRIGSVLLGEDMKKQQPVRDEVTVSKSDPRSDPDSTRKTTFPPPGSVASGGHSAGAAAALRRQLSEVQSRLAEAQHELAQHNSERAEDLERLEASSQEVAVERSKNAQLAARLGIVEADLTLAVAREKEARNELERVIKELAELRKNADDNGSQKNKLAGLLASLQGQVERGSAEKTALQQSLREREDELAQTKTKRADAEAERDRSKEAAAELHRQLEELRVVLNELESRSRDAEEGRKRAEAARSRAEAELETQRETTQARQDETTTALGATMGLVDSFSRLEAELGQLRRETFASLVKVRTALAGESPKPVIKDGEPKRQTLRYSGELEAIVPEGESKAKTKGNAKAEPAPKDALPPPAPPADSDDDGPTVSVSQAEDIEDLFSDADDESHDAASDDAPKDGEGAKSETPEPAKAQSKKPSAPPDPNDTPSKRPSRKP